MEQRALSPQPADVLAKATVRASQLLGLSGAALARTVGLSEPTRNAALSHKAPSPQRLSCKVGFDSCEIANTF